MRFDPPGFSLLAQRGPRHDQHKPILEATCADDQIVITAEWLNTRMFTFEVHKSGIEHGRRIVLSLPTVNGYSAEVLQFSQPFNNDTDDRLKLRLLSSSHVLMAIPD